jgi:hypothetical protein
MKAKLVFDMPECCAKCELSEHLELEGQWQELYKCIDTQSVFGKEQARNGRQSDCHLVPDDTDRLTAINNKRLELIQKYENYMNTDTGNKLFYSWQCRLWALKECEEQEAGK